MVCVIVGNGMLRKKRVFPTQKEEIKKSKKQSHYLGRKVVEKRKEMSKRTLGILHVDIVVYFCCIMLLRVRIPIQGSTRLEVWFMESFYKEKNTFGNISET